MQGTSSSFDVFHLESILQGTSRGQAPVQIPFILKVSYKENEGEESGVGWEQRQIAKNQKIQNVQT